MVLSLGDTWANGWDFGRNLCFQICFQVGRDGSRDQAGSHSGPVVRLLLLSGQKPAISKLRESCDQETKRASDA